MQTVRKLRRISQGRVPRGPVWELEPARIRDSRSWSLRVLGAALPRCDYAQREDRVASPAGASLAASARDSYAHWYLRTGQWRADARTVVAAVRFLFEVDAPGRPSGPLPLPGGGVAGMDDTVTRPAGTLSPRIEEGRGEGSV